MLYLDIASPTIAAKHGAHARKIDRRVQVSIYSYIGTIKLSLSSPPRDVPFKIKSLPTYFLSFNKVFFIQFSRTRK